VPGASSILCSVPFVALARCIASRAAASWRHYRTSKCRSRSGCGRHTAAFDRSRRARPPADGWRRPWCADVLARRSDAPRSDRAAASWLRPPHRAEQQPGNVRIVGRGPLDQLTRMRSPPTAGSALRPPANFARWIGLVVVSCGMRHAGRRAHAVAWGRDGLSTISASAWSAARCPHIQSH
jgi:hypothetical protein